MRINPNRFSGQRIRLVFLGIFIKFFMRLISCGRFCASMLVFTYQTNNNCQKWQFQHMISSKVWTYSTSKYPLNTIIQNFSTHFYQAHTVIGPNGITWPQKTSFYSCFNHLCWLNAWDGKVTKTVTVSSNFFFRSSNDKCANSSLPISFAVMTTISSRFCPGVRFFCAIRITVCTSHSESSELSLSLSFSFNSQ